MRSVLHSFARALRAQLHLRMLLLSFFPLLLSLLLWTLILWFFLQPLIDLLQHYFLANDGFKVSNAILAAVGLASIKTVIAPLIAIWLLLPLMILTTLFFIGLLATPAILKHVSSRHYPALEKRHGGSLLGSMHAAISSFVVFTLLWLLSLPLCLIPPLALVIQPALWGWLTYRVVAYDALAEHASEPERQDILHQHRWPLLAIGAAVGLMGALPTLACVWMGVLAIAFFPFFAGAAIWLYALVFIFTGLWFQFYCLDALAKYRNGVAAAAVAFAAPAVMEPN